jgi:hypothetical protein
VYTEIHPDNRGYNNMLVHHELLTTRQFIQGNFEDKKQFSEVKKKSLLKSLKLREEYIHGTDNSFLDFSTFL